MSIYTTEYFITRSRKIHGSKYDYSKTVYIGCVTNVIIGCQKHGDFFQRPNNHLNGAGCFKCGKELLSLQFRSDKNTFITKAQTLHNKKYIYDFVKYKNNRSKVIIICPTHGKFLQAPEDHLSGRGCVKCGRIRQAKLRTYSTEYFIQKATKIHKDSCSYEKTKYKNSRLKVIITCKWHGDFLQQPNRHLQGQGCPTCHISNSEKIIHQFLLDNHINFISEYSNQNCRNKKALFFDFAIGQESNILGLIEYQGIQHYKPQTFGSKTQSANQMFEVIQKNDFIKKNYCEFNNIPLLCISYYDKNNIENIIQTFLDSINVFQLPIIPFPNP